MTTAVPVDASISELLAFSRDFFEPFVMSMEKGRDHHASYRNKMYHTPTDALYNPTTAYATLARLAMVKITVADNETVRAAASQFHEQSVCGRSTTGYRAFWFL